MWVPVRSMGFRKWLCRTVLAAGVLVAFPLVFATQAQVVDGDGDGLPDSWEVQFGLDSTSGVGSEGAAGDPDADGRSNAEELAAATHPRGFSRRYFAEGAISTLFSTRVSLLNPSPTNAASVLVRFVPARGAVRSQHLAMPPMSRRTIAPESLDAFSPAEFATEIEADAPVVADRWMQWDTATAYGSHLERDIDAPTTHGYFAEGATHSGFQLFYLILNPGADEAHVRIEFLLPAPKAPVVKDFVVPPNRRYTVWVNTIPELANTAVSATVTSDEEVLLERAMYLDRPGELFGIGHASAAIGAPSTEWFIAEGATGPYFDLFVLLANPNATAATVKARYLLATGAVVERDYVVAAKSRLDVWVDFEGGPLADAAVSTVITADQPILAERAMWWPGSAGQWLEAHNAPGATAPGTKWAFADGETAGASSTQHYILIANTSSFDGVAKVLLAFEDGTQLEQTFAVRALSRFNVDVAAEFPSALDKRYGVIVESVSPGPDGWPAALAVERAMYADSKGQRWAAGGSALSARNLGGCGVSAPHSTVAYRLAGLNVGPFVTGQNPNQGSVLSLEQVLARLEVVAPCTTWVRTFGSTGGLESAAHLARALGLRTAVGAWLSSDLAANEREMATLIRAAKAGEVDMAIVGSETLLRHDLSPAALIGYINQFRQAVPGVPVATADVYGQLLAHPDVIAAGDVVLANFYPYHEGVSIDFAMASLHAHYQQVVAAAGSREVVVSETGWPDGGDVKGEAVPSPQNAAAYLLNFVSWARANQVRYFYFESFDEAWKTTEEGPQGAHWGIMFENGVLKPGMREVFDGKTVSDNWTVPGGPGTPAIAFASVPPVGSFDNLFGRVQHVNTQNYKVATYIQVSGLWWTKPTFASPLTSIAVDGRFEVDITTGGNDQDATRIAAFVVPAAYMPAPVGGLPTLPANLQTDAVASIEVSRAP